MKTTFLLLALLFAACKFTERDPVKDALSTEGRTANIIYVIPTTSACPDSLTWDSLASEYRSYLKILRRSVGMIGTEYYAKIDSEKSAVAVAYDSAFSRVKAAPRNPGFSLVRYTVNREPDTLTAVLDPAFRVVWPR